MIKNDKIQTFLNLDFFVLGKFFDTLFKNSSLDGGPLLTL